MQEFTRRLPLWGWVAFALVLGLSGCSRRVSLSLDENVARDSLKAALESWKKGDKQNDLQQRSPSIIMADESWEAGMRLVSYRLLDQGVSDDVNLHCKVELVVADKNGTESKRKMTYIVGTSPVITIFPK
jgi:hypothetical protein